MWSQTATLLRCKVYFTFRCFPDADVSIGELHGLSPILLDITAQSSVKSKSENNELIGIACIQMRSVGEHCCSIGGSSTSCASLELCTGSHIVLAAPSVNL